MSYIYFDINGRLREYVTTPKRKGSENVDTLFVYWEGNDGTVVLPSQCFIEYGHESIHAGPLTANKVSRTIIPFERERDLRFFQYGKTYQFMCFDLPTAVSSTSGFWHSSVSIHDRLTNNVVQVLGDITFEVEESSIVPSGNLDLSQYNYILDKVDQTLAKYDSKLDRKAPTSIVDSNENSIVDFHDNEATFYKPVHVNNEFRVRNDTGIIIEGDDGSGKFSSILDDYDLNEFSFVTDRKAFYLTFREDVSKGLVFDSSQRLSLRNGTEFLNDANTKTVLGQNLKGYTDIHTWNGTPTDPKDITTKEYVDTKVSTETDGVVKRGDLKTLNGESLLGSGDIAYDASLSATSTNAVQNKVINSTISELSYQLAMVKENLFQTVLSEIDYTEDFATLYAIPDILSDTDGTHRVLFSETQLREVAGNSVAYNQLFNCTSPTEGGGTVSFDNSTGIYTYTFGTNIASNAYTNTVLDATTEMINGHKYLITRYLNAPHSGQFYFRYQAFSSQLDVTENTWIRNDIITTAGAITADKSAYISPSNPNGQGYVQGDSYKVKQQIFDLTLMGLDSVSTVEEARSELLKRGIDIDQYNPYSKGEIRNTTASGVKVNGYNLFDGEFEIGGYYTSTGGNDNNSTDRIRTKNALRVIAGQTYLLEVTNLSYSKFFVLEYDKNDNYLNEYKITNPIVLQPNCFYVRFMLVGPTSIPTNSNTCFHLSTLRTGYAPYKEPKAISFASTELLGAGEAHDTIEVVEGDKVAGIQRYNLVHVKRVGTVDLGTLNWNVADISTNRSFVHFPGAKLFDNDKVANIVSARFKADTYNNVGSNTSGLETISLGKIGENSYLYVKTSLITASTDTTEKIKTAMSGIILNYELATPTRTTIAENLTFEEVSATIEQGGSIETVYETLAPNCTTGFVVKKATEVSK